MDRSGTVIFLVQPGRFKRQVLAGGSLLALCGIGCAFWLGGASKQDRPKEPKVGFYQDSMHPWIKSDRPGKCTLCAMDLTPILEGDRGFAKAGGLVALSSNSITVLNIQAEKVKRQPLRLSLRVAGTLEADESRKAVFSAPAAGRIQEMLVGAVGDEVEVEKPLLTFYSPDLTTWRRAYVVRSRMNSSGTPLFAGRAHEDTRGNGPSKAGANAMAQTNGSPVANRTEPDPYFSDLLSPLSGTIVERKVFNGQYVAEGDRMLTIVDTSVLWFRFDVYDRQLPWLRKGQNVQVTIAALPGQEFGGVISVIEPTIDEATRTVKVRANIANPVIGDATQKQRLLRLGMYAEGTVLAELPSVLTVPRTAVLLPGGQAYVYVEAGAGAYAMRAVKLGRQGDGLCEVLEGLEEGEGVVTAGNILIDAQAQFNQPYRPELAQVEGKAQLATSDNQVHSVKGMPASEAVIKVAPPVQTPRSESSTTITRTQGKALDGFLSVASDISAALASDSLGDLQRAVARLKGMTAVLSGQFGKAHPWSATIQSVAAASAWPEAKDLATARATFLPFSTEVVKLVQFLQASESEPRSLKIYHCPMAPKPGLWFQDKGPLRNPYYGAKMLSCGEEVPGSGQASVVASRITAPAPEAAPVVQPTAPANTIRTMNTRHPEAKEQMLRSFALGIAEQHRMAAKVPAVRSTATEKATGDSAAKPVRP